MPDYSSPTVAGPRFLADSVYPTRSIGTRMHRVGLVGVGTIGKVYLDRLLDADYEVTIFDIDDSQVAYAVDRGATSAPTPAVVARNADAVLFALPGTPEVEATMEGDDGVLAGLDAGDLLVDSSTTHPDTSLACAEACEARDVRFVEAPITGAAPREGYQVMVGGTTGNYDAATDLLDVVADDHVRIGDVGEATVFKLGLQMRYAGHRAVDAEVVEFLRDGDVDPAPLSEFLGLDVWEQYFTREFGQAHEGLGSLAIWHKDIGYARDVARENATALPVNAAIHEAYKATVRRVAPDEGHASTLLRYWERLNDAESREA